MTEHVQLLNAVFYESRTYTIIWSPEMYKDNYPVDVLIFEKKDQR